MTAASSAHLTGTADSTKPSVFEILSHEGFANALKPAAFHIIKVIVERNPGGKYAFAYHYFDELYLMFDAVVQWHYILTRGATLSETFYGLERKLTTPKQKLTRLRLSYIASVLLPYISSKLERLYKDHLEEVITESQTSQPTQKKTTVTSKFLALYPYLKALVGAVNLYYLLSFTFGYTEHHSATFRLLGMSLGYMSQDRYKFMEAKNAELWMAANWKNPIMVPQLMMRGLGESVLYAVEMGTFFIQFLEWWYNDDRKARVALASVPVPPAPHKAHGRKTEVQSFVNLRPEDMDKCPICRKQFKNPTAISVSGVVYCYGCILPYLRKESMCPLTKLACNSNHLIRIYQS
ncbi:unnamed protein product [Orchesella dallaii]|uniref:Peroxisome assembly protein 12 n=1 Tax=Orchesella dallaii TaxID=48710 RepID=A0ABP1Q912_9HEXA